MNSHKKYLKELGDEQRYKKEQVMIDKENEEEKVKRIRVQSEKDRAR